MGQDPVYQAPTPMERHDLLVSPETVSILVVRHPMIRKGISKKIFKI
jgi:hypothetical protein